MLRPAIYRATILVAPLLLFSQNASAQAGGSQEIGSTQEITVIAPRVTVREDPHQPAGSIGKVVIYSVTQRVSFADLDLRSVPGVNELKKRIQDAAKSGCDLISSQYPLLEDHGCLNNAIDQAMIQANSVIALANK